MASSSSSSFKYDLFLSFHGEDTRKTFVDHLYAALHRNSICTFKDDKKLEKGKKISDDLLESIENSRFYIIVFSKNYASSSWCLNELVKIMECHKKMKEQIAFPVFYNVEPSDVRKQRGPIGESIGVHESKNVPEVGKWKEALKDAADLSGWHLARIADGHEAGAIKKIVHYVSSKLHGINMKVDENLIGMEQRMEALDSYLQVDSDDVLMIGIKGMGGSGKTTLAGAIFDKICITFEAKSFVQNVKEKSSGCGLEKLQKQILEDVLKEKDIRVTSVHEGKKLLKDKLKDKKVLIVLDDVDDQDQLERLAGDLKWFGPGSRIIITTRDAKVLNKLKENRIYNINLLSNEEAIRLLSRHAFGRDDPIQEFERQSHEVVRYAAGLPLTLKTLGSLLCGADKKEWEDVLGRLKTIPLKETLKVLELSYESLDDDQKEIFSKLPDKLGGLGCLQELDLSHLSKLQDIPGSICKLRHLKKLNLSLCSSLKRLPGDIGDLESLQELNLSDLSNLRDIPGSICKLRHLKKLNLSLCSSLKRLPGDIGDLESLQELNLSDLSNLRDIPGSICKLRHLKKLNLSLCTSLERLPGDIGDLESLQELHLSDLSNLRDIPGSICKLRHLKKLNLSLCTSLERLPGDIGDLESLQELHLSDLSNLRDIPGSICKLRHLKRLNLSLCTSIERLPGDIGDLESLQELHLSDLSNLRDIPGSICKLIHLKNLNLSLCTSLKRLPGDIGDLESLQELNLSDLSNLREIPGSICKLKHLKKLNLSLCTSLKRLPGDIGDLESLQELNLSDLSNLREIPGSICKLKHLKQLNFYGCNSLENLPGKLGDLDCLLYRRHA